MTDYADSDDTALTGNDVIDDTRAGGNVVINTCVVQRQVLQLLPDGDIGIPQQANAVLASDNFCNVERRKSCNQQQKYELQIELPGRVAGK